MGDVTRRKFVHDRGGAGAAVTIVPRHVLGHGFQAPSDTVNIAIVGFGGMGEQRAGADEPEPRGLLRRARLETAAAIKRFAETAAPDRPARRRTQREPSKAQQEANARRPAQNSRENLKRFVDQQLPKLQRTGLPRDAREAEGHRRGRRRHARSHARADRARGDGPRQARLRAEAALLVGRRSATARQEGEGQPKVVTPDGQPGPLDRRRAHRLENRSRAARSATSAKCTSGRTGRSATGRRAFRGRRR